MAPYYKYLRPVSLFTLSLGFTFIQLAISSPEQTLASPSGTRYQPSNRLKKKYYTSEQQLWETGLQLPALSFQRKSNDRQREEGSYYYAVRAHERYGLKTRSSQEKTKKKNRLRPGDSKERTGSHKSSSSSGKGKGKGKGKASGKFQSKSKSSKDSSKKKKKHQKSKSSKSSSKTSKSKSSKMAAKQASVEPSAVVPTLSPGPTVPPRVRETTAPAASLAPQTEAPTRSPNTDPTTELPTLSPNADPQMGSPTLSPASDLQPTVSPVEDSPTQTMSPMMDPPALAETRAPVVPGDGIRFDVLFDIRSGTATEADLDAAGVVTLQYLEDYYTTQFEFNRLTNMEAFLGDVVGIDPAGSLSVLEIDVVFSEDSQYIPLTEDITSLLFASFQEPFVSGLITLLQTELPANNPVSATTQVCNSIWLLQCPFG